MFNLMSTDDKYLTCDRKNVFKCRHDRCLNDKYRCDGKNDCGGYYSISDELGCGKN
jgi:hypothetical protein